MRGGRTFLGTIVSIVLAGSGGLVGAGGSSPKPPARAEAPETKAPAQAEAPITKPPAPAEAPVTKPPAQAEAPVTKPPAQAEAPAPKSPAIVIRGATILTVTKGTIAGGSVIVRDGRIEAVGTDLAVPEGAHVIEARRRFLTPGLIALASTIGRTARPAAPRTDPGTSPPRASMPRAVDELSADDPAIPRALAFGITTAQVLPGSGNGEAAVVKLVPGRGRAAMVDSRAPATLVLGPDAGLPDLCARARAPEKPAKDGAAHDVDPRTELLARAMRGDANLHMRCTTEGEIRSCLDAVRGCGSKSGALVGAAEAYKLAGKIREAGIAVVTTPAGRGAGSASPDAIPQNPALLVGKGITVAIAAGTSSLPLTLSQEAARAVRWGDLDRDRALALVTINPAQILGLDGVIGSIEPGKEADLVLFDRDPLSIYAQVQMTMIRGEILYDRDRDYDRFLADALTTGVAGLPPEAPAGNSGP